MTDVQIAKEIDFIHAPGLGRGGFEVLLSLCPILYEDNAILLRLNGEYVNPLGPFRKWIKLRSGVMTPEYEYNLFYHIEFWKSCSEREIVDKHLIPFLNILRMLINEQVNYNDVRVLYPEYSYMKTELKEHEKEYFKRSINRLK